MVSLRPWKERHHEDRWIANMNRKEKITEMVEYLQELK